MEQLQSWLVNIDKSYFERAQVTIEPFTYDGTTVISKLYVLFLHEVCLIFGNVYNACLIAHFITYIFATFIWFLVIKKLVKSVTTSILLTLCIFVPLGFMLSVTLNPFVLWILLFGIVLLIIISCIKGLLNDNTNKEVVSNVQSGQPEQVEPVVTVVNFDDENAVIVPKEEEITEIFIPKSMEIPKRVSKPKLDYSLAVAEDALFYDIDVADLDDFDLPNMT